MGRLGSAMKNRLFRVAAVVMCGTLIYAAAVLAGGVTFGVPFYLLDLSGTLDRIPTAVEGALAEVEGALIDLGVPPADLDELRDRIDETLDQVHDFAQTLPPFLPVPLLGGTVEISLPLIVVDSLRLTGGLLSDGLLRGVVRLAGAEIPQPLFDATFDSDGFAGQATIDIAFSSWMLSTDVVKRFDVIVLALTLGGGIDLIGGEIRPLVDLDVPAVFEDGAAGALEALHLDGLTWSAFAVHGVVGLEIGPPFLRIYGDVRFLLPVSEAANWWDLRLGGLAAVLGVVIRF
jgi:hypothetical protein